MCVNSHICRYEGPTCDHNNENSFAAQQYIKFIHAIHTMREGEREAVFIDCVWVLYCFAFCFPFFFLRVCFFSIHSIDIAIFAVTLAFSIRMFFVVVVCAGFAVCMCVCVVSMVRNAKHALLRVKTENI